MQSMLRRETKRPASVRLGMILEATTLAWNVMGVAVLAFAVYRSRSVALAGFGLDTIIEIGASIVVLWELRDVAGTRRSHALRLIGGVFLLLGAYLLVQSLVVLFDGFHSRHSTVGIAWTAVTAVVMFVLACAKTRVGHALVNQVLITEGRVTFVDGVVSSTVLIGLVLNAAVGWWWADPVAGLLIAAYSVREGLGAVRHSSGQSVMG